MGRGVQEHGWVSGELPEIKERGGEEPSWLVSKEPGNSVDLTQWEKGGLQVLRLQTRSKVSQRGSLGQWLRV